MILSKGLGALKKEAEEKLAALDDAVPGDLEKSFFYKAEILAADAVIHLANRHADLAEQMAAECTDEKRKAEPVSYTHLYHRVNRLARHTRCRKI